MPNKHKIYYKKIINQQTGKVKLLKHYKNGIVNGKFIYYWDNGSIRLTGQYINMKRCGIWKTYDSNGKLILEESFGPKIKNNNNQMILFS